MSTIVFGACLLMLAGAAAGVMYRLVKGPAMLDRVLASDVLLSVVATAVALEMVWSGHTDYMMVIVTIALLGFIGSVSVARFVQPTRPRSISETAEEARSTPEGAASSAAQGARGPSAGADDGRKGE